MKCFLKKLVSSCTFSRILWKVALKLRPSLTEQKICTIKLLFIFYSSRFAWKSTIVLRQQFSLSSILLKTFFSPNFILQKLRNREKISLALFRSRFEKCKVTEPIDWKTQYPELGLIKWEETVTQYFSDEVVWII